MTEPLNKVAKMVEKAIKPDGDEAGATGARQAAKRFVQEGRAVRIVPAPEGQDFNDMLRSEARPA